MVDEGGTRSQAFWKHRRKAIGKNRKIKYKTLDEEGKELNNKEEEMEHIANYFEDLYEARKAATPEAEESTKYTEEKVEEIKEIMKDPDPPPDITMDQLNKQIKTLKRKKSTGPDDIPHMSSLVPVYA